MKKRNNRKIFILAIFFIFIFFSLVLINFAFASSKIDLWSIYISDPSKVTVSENDGEKGNPLDGNTGTYWHATIDDCEPGTPGTWTMNMGSSYNVDNVRVNGNAPNCTAYLSSNGVDYTQIGQVAPCWGWNDFNTSSIAQYVRVSIGGTRGCWEPVFDVYLYELEVYQAGGGTPTPTGGTPTPPPSGTPTPSGSVTTSPSVGPTDGPGPIVCANPPCFQDPDDPIYPPSPTFNIELLVPDGGEVWKIGKEYTIKWKYTDNEQKIKKFALFLSKDEGKNYRQVIEQNIDKSKKEYEWSIPDDESYVTDKARVLVAAYGDSIDRPLLNDTSDNNFKIISSKQESLSTSKFRLPFILALILLLLSGSAVLWPLTLNFLLNSFITSFLNRLALLTAPTMGNKKGTGIVYDSYTKSSIPKAMVRIFNVENNKQLESIITNKKGEFSFIIPNGNYYLKANSTNYDFPSQKLKKTNDQAIFKPGITDGTYSNLYFGEGILVNKENPQERYALNINIPLDKTKAFNLEERMLKILRTIGSILIKIKWPSIAICTALSLYSVWSNFSILNMVILELYLLLILYEVYRLLVRARPYGLVMDEDQKTVDLAVVRFNQNKKIKATSISGNDGKFTAQVDPGDYKLLTKKNGFMEDKKQANIKSARQLEGLDIRLKRI